MVMPRWNLFHVDYFFNRCILKPRKIFKSHKKFLAFRVYPQPMAWNIWHFSDQSVFANSIFVSSQYFASPSAQCMWICFRDSSLEKKKNWKPPMLNTVGLIFYWLQLAESRCLELVERSKDSLFPVAWYLTPVPLFLIPLFPYTLIPDSPIPYLPREIRQS